MAGRMNRVAWGALAVMGWWVLASDSAVRGDDWPHWFGPQRDGVWHETGILESFPEGGPPVVWRAEIGAGYAGPAVVGDRVYVMDRVKDEGKGREVENAIRKAGKVPGLERVLCLDTKSGATIWTHSYDAPYAIAYPTGPRCTPAVDGEHVYTLGAMGHLICLRTADGQVVWEKNLPESYSTKPPVWGYASHPYVDGDRLLVPVGGAGSALVAFDKRTGAEMWKAGDTSDVAYAPLAIAERDGKRQLIYWHADAVESYNPETGEKYWSVKFPLERNLSQTSIATPVFSGNQLLISEYYKGSVLLDVGFDPPSVKEVWRNPEGAEPDPLSLNSLMTTPVVRDGLAWGIANIGEGDGVFRCIRLANSELVWTKPDWLSPKPQLFATAFIIPNGDRYFLFNDLGELMIAKLSEEGFTELGRAPIVEPTGVARGRRVVWSHPAFAGGMMFARNDKELVCVDLRKK